MRARTFRLLLLNFPAVSGLEVVVLARAHPHLLLSTKLTCPPLPLATISLSLSLPLLPSLSALEANALAGLRASRCQIGGPSHRAGRGSSDG